MPSGCSKQLVSTWHQSTWRGLHHQWLRQLEKGAEPVRGARQIKWSFGLRFCWATPAENINRRSTRLVSEKSTRAASAIAGCWSFFHYILNKTRAGVARSHGSGEQLDSTAYCSVSGCPRIERVCEWLPLLVTWHRERAGRRYCSHHSSKQATTGEMFSYVLGLTVETVWRLILVQTTFRAFGLRSHRIDTLTISLWKMCKKVWRFLRVFWSFSRSRAAVGLASSVTRHQMTLEKSSCVSRSVQWMTNIKFMKTCSVCTKSIGRMRSPYPMRLSMCSLAVDYRCRIAVVKDMTAPVPWPATTQASLQFFSNNSQRQLLFIAIAIA